MMVGPALSPFLLVLLAAAPDATTQPATTRPAVLPVLVPDTQVAKTLSQLGAGESAILPPIRTTGDLNDVAKKYHLDDNGPRGRDYCVEMIWMADRQRALYAGANHGSPHRLNDVWEYDLPSNAWVCLYGPDDLGRDGKAWGSAWEGVTLKEGILRTKRGGPAIVGHQWSEMTYDPLTGTMYFNSEWPVGYFPKNIQEQYLRSGTHRHSPQLWSFRPASGTWTPVRTKQPAPRTGHAVNKYLQYVPSLKGLLFVDCSRPVGTWLYRPKDRSWKDLLPGDDKSKIARFNEHLPFRVGVKAFCPDRNVLVVCTRDKDEHRTVEYDVAKNAWTRTAHGVDTPAGHCARTPCGYDAVAGIVLLYDQQSHVLWGYDVGRKTWSRVTPKGPAPFSQRGKVIGYYDPARNVFVLCQGPRVWVYRHRVRVR